MNLHRLGWVAALLSVTICGSCKPSVPTQQELGVASSQTEPERFYEGRWRTTEASPITVITSRMPSSEPSRLYLVTSHLDSQGQDFQLQSERGVKGVAPTLAGAVAIDAKSLEVQGIGTQGKRLNGLWAIPNIEPPNGYTRHVWHGYVGRNAIVADFATERVMTIRMLAESCDSNTARMRVIVDGVPIKNSNGAEVAFVPGSSLLFSGKSVVVNVTGNCSQSLINGILNIRN